MWTYCSFFPSNGNPSEGKPFNQALVTDIGKNKAYSSLSCPGPQGPLGCCFSNSVSTNQIIDSRSTSNRYGDPSVNIDSLRKSAASGQLCLVKKESRVDCGVDGGWDEAKCLADPTCCYERLEDSSGPWCYGNSKKPIPGPGPGPGPDPGLPCGKNTCPPFSSCVSGNCICFQGRAMSKDGTCVAAQASSNGTVAWIVVLAILLICLVTALVLTWKYPALFRFL